MIMIISFRTMDLIPPGRLVVVEGVGVANAALTEAVLAACRQLGRTLRGKDSDTAGRDEMNVLNVFVRRDNAHQIIYTMLLHGCFLQGKRSQKHPLATTALFQERKGKYRTIDCPIEFKVPPSEVSAVLSFAFSRTQMKPTLSYYVRGGTGFALLLLYDLALTATEVLLSALKYMANLFELYTRSHEDADSVGTLRKTRQRDGDLHIAEGMHYNTRFRFLLTLPYRAWLICVIGIHQRFFQHNEST